MPDLRRIAHSATARNHPATSAWPPYRLAALWKLATLILAGVALLFSPLVHAGQEAGSSDRPMPTLRFEPPAGFMKSGGDIFTPNSYANASVKIVYFRPFHGKLEDEVSRSLMNEWVQHLNRQVRYSTAPSHEPRTVPGAESAMLSAFVEDYWGKPCINLRLAMVASEGVAIVYVWADHDAWANYQTSVETFLRSIKVESAEKLPAANLSPQQNAARRAIAGLYLGQWMGTTRFYLLSEDGRFYRGQRLPSAPGGDIRRFDYQHARELDPANSGTYRVTGMELVIQFPGQNPITVTLQADDTVKIEGIAYKRQPL